MDLVIWGSCVTRDAAEFLDPARWHLTCYVARQSVASAGHPVTDPTLTALRLPSTFQDRMYHDDLAGNALARVRAAIRDSADTLLVLDLIDERGGMDAHPDGAVLTRTPESVGTGAVDLVEAEGSTWKRHNFGSLQHWLAFKDGAEDARRAVEDLGLWERTYVLRAHWATVDTDGEEPPPSFGLRAVTANESLDLYYDLLDSLGWRFIDPESDGSTPVADPAHKWGGTPFHYTRPYYDAICAGLNRAAGA